MHTPLYKLTEEMPYDEYISWIKYFNIRPPGQADDFRAAMIVKSLSSDVEITKIFPSLKEQKKNETIGENIKNSSMFSRLMAAQGGDKIGA